MEEEEEEEQQVRGHVTSMGRVVSVRPFTGRSDS